MRGPKRAYIKFPGIGLCRYKIVLDTVLRVHKKFNVGFGLEVEVATQR